MKNLLLLILVLSTFSSSAQTSIYHPFPDSNAIWNVHFSLYCFQNGTGDEYYTITFSGDTSIGSQTYHKLSTPYVQSFSTGTCGGLLAGYKGAIRQDILNKKVFFIPPETNTEQLLYDFTMQVGDTVHGYIETTTSPPDIVQSIDSVLVGNSYCKRWNIDSCYQIYFIEGIGSTYGLIERSPGCVTDWAGYSIVCFKQNGHSQYPDTSANCSLITSVKPVRLAQNEIKISPNPSHGSFTIDIGNALNIKEYRLSDLLGNTIQQQKTDNRTKIKINNLQIGTYILTVFDNEENATNRIIISCP